MAIESAHFLIRSLSQVFVGLSIFISLGHLSNIAESQSNSSLFPKAAAAILQSTPHPLTTRGPRPSPSAAPVASWPVAGMRGPPPVPPPPPGYYCPSAILLVTPVGVRCHFFVVFCSVGNSVTSGDSIPPLTFSLGSLKAAFGACSMFVGREPGKRGTQPR